MTAFITSVARQFALTTIILAIATITGCSGCNRNKVEVQKLTVGFLTNGPANDSGYNAAHDDGRKQVDAKFTGEVKTKLLENVPETADAGKVMERLINDGAKLIVATSFGYQDSTVDVAARYKDVRFLQAWGFKHSDNVASYSAKMYEPWYLMGIVAGRMTKTGKLGVVAAHPIPPMKWQINAYAIGAKSVRPDIQVTVSFINHWFDPVKSGDATEALINQGHDVICGVLDNSVGVAQAVEKNGKAWLIGHNTDLSKFAPTRHLVGTRWLWGKLYQEEVQAVLNGTWKGGSDRAGGLKEGYVGITDFSTPVPDEVRKEVQAARDKITQGTLAVYTGPLRDNAGKERVAAGRTLTHEDIMAMDWLVEGVR
jgi:basic membrane protein A